MKLSNDELNAFWVLKSFFNSKKVRVTSTTLRTQLLQEPTFPSIMALSNVLTDYNIYNIPLVIKPEQLHKIPLPAIAHFANGMEYIYITKVENNQVEFHHNQLGKLRESIAYFSQKWQGLILIANPEGDVKENNFEGKVCLEIFQKLRIPFIYISLVVVLRFFTLKCLNDIPLQYVNIFYNIFFAKIIGITLSVVLIKLNIYRDKSITESTSTLDKLKNTFIKTLILKSRKIFGSIVWAEIGLIYFLVGLSSLFWLESENKLVLTKWLNFFTIIYIIWAICYQIFAIKKWCLLCILSILFLCTEFYLLRQIPLFAEKYDLSSFNVILIYLLLIITTWVFVRPHLINSIFNESLYISFQRTKFNLDFVRNTFTKEQRIPPLFGEMQSVLIGNPSAEYTLLAVLNPNSDLSSIRFHELVSLSSSNEQFNCKVILVPDSLEDIAGKRVVKKILSHTDKQRFDALTSWFKYRNLKYIRRFNSTISEDKLDIAIHENINWVFLARTSLATPAVYLNNNLLPSIYSIKEVPILFRILNSK
jgi:hypothetical protein